MIKLYQRTDCPFCWKVRLALAEAGVRYHSVDTRLGEQHADVAWLSPSGTVPVLVDGDLVIWESAVILEYLDCAYAPGTLIPQDAKAAARVRLMHAYSDKLVGPSLRDLVFEKRSKPHEEWNQDVIAQSEKRWRECQAYLENSLSKHGHFGAPFSAADCAIGSRLGVAEAYGAGVTTEFPALSAWYGAITARPGWVQAYPTHFPGYKSNESGVRHHEHAG